VLLALALVLTFFFAAYWLALRDSLTPDQRTMMQSCNEGWKAVLAGLVGMLTGKTLEAFTVK
jgi:hypothetical protein